VDFGNEKVPFPLTQFFSGPKNRVKGGLPVPYLKGFFAANSGRSWYQSHKKCAKKFPT
jgi:hypothetical protein